MFVVDDKGVDKTTIMHDDDNADDYAFIYIKL